MSTFLTPRIPNTHHAATYAHRRYNRYARQRRPEAPPSKNNRPQTYVPSILDLPVKKRLKVAKTRLEEVRSLVASDALTRARAVATEDTVAKVKQAEQEALTTWTSRLSSLQTQVQAARLSIRQAEAKKQQAAGKQWVKTPVAGLVVDIRLIEVGVAGVTLEVLVERQKSSKN